MNKKVIFITSVITAVVVLVLATVFYLSPLGMILVGRVSDSCVSQNYGKLMKIESIIENEYMGSHNSERQMDRAIRAYVSSLEDPYSVYYSSNEFKDLRSELEGVYRGIGVSVASSANEIVIKKVTPSSPAEKAGLTAGDVILSVNGTEYTGSQLSDAVNAIKKTPVGKAVSLKIRRDSRVLDVTIKIEKVKEVLVTSRVMTDSIGYVNISTFGSTVAKDFSEALKNLVNSGIKALIIDLRNNPGGTLDSAVEVSDCLLPKGNIVTIRDKKGNEEIYTSDEDALNLPICVLINEKSASASEVVAGALRDNGRAIVVGKKSFGKGVVQSVMDLGDGSGISLTIAKYFTPSGTCIHGIGIYPDIEVDLPEDVVILPDKENKNDTQLAAAAEALKQQIKQ